ncbi:MAG: hypothetical protein MK101_08200 [Phycisphaerales bacterium]|nr:hypothetical protein [Phycisphaerales bacterium]
MRYLIAFYLFVLALMIIRRIIRQAINGEVELFSTRNLFMAGFIVFQMSSAILGLGFFIFGDIQPENFQTTPLIYAFMVSVFLWLFYWAYRREWSVLERIRRPGSGWDGDAGGWLMLGIVMLGLGAFLKMALLSIPLINIVASQMGGGVLAAAAGCAGWAWAKNFRNPSVAAISLVILAAASSLILYQAFGRRPVLGVLMAFGWGLYWGAWRALPATQLVRRLAIWGFAGMFLLIAYTASRSAAAQYEKRGIVEMLRAVVDIRPADFSEGIAAVFSGQNAGGLSMWSIETYGSAYPYDPFHQVKYLASIPIPRAVWPGKPDPLGKLIVDHGYIRLKGSGNKYNVGPGIIGHAAHDFPWLALPLYAVGLGFLIRCIDEKTKWSVHLPVVLIPLGAALGQIMALPRGESALFLFESVMAIGGAWIFIRLGGRIVALFGGLVQTPPEEPFDPLLGPEDPLDEIDQAHLTA